MGCRDSREGTTMTDHLLQRVAVTLKSQRTLQVAAFSTLITKSKFCDRWWDSDETLKGGVLAPCSLLIFVHSPCSLLIFSRAPCIFALLLPCNFSFSLLPWKKSICSLILSRPKIRKQLCTTACSVLVKSFAHYNRIFFQNSLEERGKLWKLMTVYSGVLQLASTFKVSPWVTENS